MNGLTRVGIFCIVLSVVVLFLGLFPSAVNVNIAPGIGIAQIAAILFGLYLLILGGYVIAYAVIQRGHPRTLTRDIGVRLGMTGLVFAAAASFADVMGFGTHSAGGFVFGWLQALGLIVGFLISAIGVLVYGLARH